MKYKGLRLYYNFSLRKKIELKKGLLVAYYSNGSPKVKITNKETYLKSLQTPKTNNWILERYEKEKAIKKD